MTQQVNPYIYTELSALALQDILVVKFKSWNINKYDMTLR